MIKNQKIRIFTINNKIKYYLIILFILKFFIYTGKRFIFIHLDSIIIKFYG